MVWWGEKYEGTMKGEGTVAWEILPLRLVSRSRDMEHAPRSFLFSRPPFFDTLLISFPHQTTFLKKKKTYGNLFGGTD